MNPKEEWRPVPGFEDRYHVSNIGRVRSEARGKPRLLRGTLDTHGYQKVFLCREGRVLQRPIHQLVAEAFIGARPEGQEVRHLDGDSLNNHIGNLAYGTRSENMLDRVAHGRHPQTVKTHCVNDHEFTPENTYFHLGWRKCRTCRRAHRTAYRERQMLRAAGVSTERAA